MNRLRFFVNEGKKLSWNCTVTASKRKARLVLTLTTPYLHSTPTPIGFINTIFLIHALLTRIFLQAFPSKPCNVLPICANNQTKRHSSFNYYKIVHIFIVNISRVIATPHLPYHFVLAFLTNVLLLSRYDSAFLTPPSKVKYDMHPNLAFRGG